MPKKKPQKRRPQTSPRQRNNHRSTGHTSRTQRSASSLAQLTQVTKSPKSSKSTQSSKTAQPSKSTQPAKTAQARKSAPSAKTATQARKSAPSAKTATQAASRSRSAQPSTPRLTPKTPEALPLKSEKISTVTRLAGRFFKKPAIQEVVREPTAGGIVFRPTRDRRDIEILLIQDSKGRWTIPKGHIEPGETAKQTAIREIGEEAGLFHIEVLMWLGKIHFQYRRVDKLVLMMTQIYLVRALDDHETPHKEQWMKGIKWFRFNDAINAIEYEDIEKLMLVAKNKIRQGLLA